jgi:hypothetical protein
MNLNQAKARVVATGNVMAIVTAPDRGVYIFRDFTYSTEVRADVGYFDSNTGVHCYGDGSGEAQAWLGRDGDREDQTAVKLIMELAGGVDVHGDSLHSKYLMAACIAYHEGEAKAAIAIADKALVYVKQRGV